MPGPAIRSSHVIDIQWGVRRDKGFPSDEKLQEWGSLALDQLGTPPAEICVRMMDEAEIAELNQRYRNKAGPTNVLSFAGEGEDESGRRMLGDLAICTAIVKQEALAQDKTLAAHSAHMLVHGILHLNGYDHENDQDAKEMEQLEVAILQRIGFPDPYADPGPGGRSS